MVDVPQGDPAFKQPPVSIARSAHGPLLDPARCLDCYYLLEELSTQRCPECGRTFDPTDASTFTRKPPLMRWKLWLPALVQAAAFGSVAMALLVLLGSWGWALWIALPLAAGCLLGYRLRVRYVFWPIAIVTLVLCLILTVMVLQIGGVFCGLILSGIFFGPLAIGTTAGGILRLMLKQSDFSQRAYLPSIFLLLLLVIGGVIEARMSKPAADVSIETTRIINAPIDDAWQSIMFYEEVTHTPPLILRIGLAHPLATRGDCQSVGDVKTCIYNRGHITKQITQVNEPNLLAFRVTEQSIGYEHDVRLRGGRFTLDAVDASRTRITLTTTYQPLLGPRFAWQWGEKIAVHALHNHVIDGMQLQAHRLNELHARRAQRPASSQHGSIDLAP